MKKILFIITLSLSTLLAMAQSGINFAQSTLDEVFAKAKSENKMVFIDCYASWCGPCKKMSAEVFTNSEVATYAEQKFVSYKMDVEAAENKEFITAFKITSMPTLIFLDADRKVINLTVGALGVPGFMRRMKITTGEALTFTQLYDKLKDDKDGSLTREFLLNAPSDIRTVPRDEQAKWKARTETIHAKYMKSKPMSQFINRDDFIISVSFKSGISKNDELFKFICDNYQAYKNVFEDITPARYIITNHSNLITDLAKKGDKDYLVELERMNGDLKEVYAELKASNSLDIYTLRKYSADATYLIYSKKDVPAFIEHTDNYFTSIGDAISPNDYEQAAVDLFTAFQGKLPEIGYNKCKIWLDSALKFQLPEQKQIQYLLMLSDCYRMTKEDTKTKECLNKAYILAMQIGDVRSQTRIKAVLQSI